MLLPGSPGELQTWIQTLAAPAADFLPIEGNPLGCKEAVSLGAVTQPLSPQAFTECPLFVKLSPMLRWQPQPGNTVPGPVSLYSSQGSHEQVDMTQAGAHSSLMAAVKRLLRQLALPSGCLEANSREGRVALPPEAPGKLPSWPFQLPEAPGGP